jgi:hypothetical protein
VSDERVCVWVWVGVCVVENAGSRDGVMTIKFSTIILHSMVMNLCTSTQGILFSCPKH